MTKWPTKEAKDVMYKFQGLWMNHNHSLTPIERQTYNTLEWFGDVGGIFDGLKLFAAILVSPVATFALRTELLAQAFRHVITGHGE